MAFEDEIKKINRRIGQLLKKGEREVAREYAAALLKVRAIMAKQYEKFEKDGALSYEEMLKHDRLKKLTQEINHTMGVHYKEVSGVMDRVLGETYTEGYYRTAWNIERETKVQLGYSSVSKETMGEMLQNPVAGLTLNARLEKQRRHIVHEIQQQITQGLIKNETYSTMSKRLKGELEGDAVKAMRIVRTEGHRVQESAKHNAADHANKNGVIMMKEWNTMQDARVRPSRGGGKGKSKGKSKRRKKSGSSGGVANHQILDGVKIPMDEMFNDGLGEGLAPGQLGAAGSDINCRCLLTYSVERVEKPTYDPLKNMPYDEWMATQVKPAEPKPKDEPKPRTGGPSAVDKVRAAAAAAAKQKAQPKPQPKPAATAPMSAAEKIRAAAAAAAANPPGGITVNALERFKDVTTTKTPLSATNLRAYSKEILDNAGLGHVKVGIKKINANGMVRYYRTPRGPEFYADVFEFSLLSTDKRPGRYKIKTMFHEYYHANYHNLELDNVRGFDNMRVSWEETATEVAAHWMIKEKGIKEMVVPSYANHLAKNLPRLKQLDEFKDAVTIEDFGARFMKYRFDPEHKTGKWKWLDEKVNAANTDFNYFRYVSRNYDDYINQNRVEALKAIAESVEEGYSESDNVLQQINKQINDGMLGKKNTFGYDAAVVWAMKKIGVK